MITLNSPTGQPTAAFSPAAYGGATGRTANFGYGTLGGNGALRGPRGGSLSVPSAPAAVPQLGPNEGIGIDAVKPENIAPASRHGSFLKGIGAGRLLSGGGLFGGGGETAAGAAGAAEELAPLAVAAL